MSDTHLVTSLGALEALYGKQSQATLEKVSPHLTPEYIRWIEASPFFAIASVGLTGVDCSPRGDDTQQLFRILDNKTVAIPDRRGNNRLDTLRNIVADPRISLLFLIPGINETMRVIGDAKISADPQLIESFQVNGKLPATVILVSIGSVYFQCARALVRSKLWDTSTHVERSCVPTAGEMVKAAHPTFDAEAYDRELPGRQKKTLY